MADAPHIYVRQLVLKNFKQFESLDVEFSSDMNILVGDNGAGKTTILQALDFTLSGSSSRVNSAGLENLFTISAIDQANSSAKSINELPQMVIEVWLGGYPTPPSPSVMKFFGERNLASVNGYGIKLVCEPNEDFNSEIEAYLACGTERSFPFEFYRVTFKTFSDEFYSPYNRPITPYYIDSSVIDTLHSLNLIVRNSYRASTVASDRARNNQRFQAALDKTNDELVFSSNADNQGKIVVSCRLEDNLNIREEGVLLRHQGAGAVSILTINFALTRKDEVSDVILLEEPENHLSPHNLLKLIDDLRMANKGKQLFISTHNSHIVSGLGLKQVVFIANSLAASLSNINKETSEFFQKAPNDNLLRFVLAKKVLLVEGAAEKILLNRLVHDGMSRELNQEGLEVISLNGLSFKRFADIAELLSMKVAAIRDNDHDPHKVTDPNGQSDSFKYFTDSDPNRWTFEVCLYDDNKTLCDTLFEERLSKSVQEFMLSNKTEAAFQLSTTKADERLNIPSYIREGVEWLLADK